MVGLIEQRASAIFKMFVAASPNLPSDVLASATNFIDVAAIQASHGPAFAHRIMAAHTLAVSPPDWSDDEESDLGDEVDDEESGELRARPLSRLELFALAEDKIKRVDAGKERHGHGHGKGSSGSGKDGGSGDGSGAHEHSSGRASGRGRGGLVS